MSNGSMMTRPPIFIIGSPRSGTTLLRLMVTSHPAIIVPPECGFVLWWRERYRDWQRADPRLDEYLDDLFRSRKIETWKLDRAALRDFIIVNQPVAYRALVSAVYEFFARVRQPTAHRWGDKNNFHLHHIAELRELFPDALFVHIVRDGRDVCCSYRQLQRMVSGSAYAPKLPVAPVDVAAEWAGNLRAISAAFDALAWQSVHELRYEDLVSSPESELRRLCAFLGEDFDPAMLGYAEKNRREQLEPPEFLAWKPLTLAAPDAQQVGRFRHDLDPAQIAEFEAVAGEVLARYRYAT